MQNDAGLSVCCFKQMPKKWTCRVVFSGSILELDLEILMVLFRARTYSCRSGVCDVMVVVGRTSQVAFIKCVRAALSGNDQE